MGISVISYKQFEYTVFNIHAQYIDLYVCMYAFAVAMFAPNKDGCTLAHCDVTNGVSSSLVHTLTRASQHARACKHTHTNTHSDEAKRK